MAFAEDRTGALHLLVNNAGISGLAVETGGHRIDKYRRAPQWRLPGQRYAIPAMKRAGGGSIVNIASISGREAQILMRGGPAGTGVPKLVRARCRDRDQK